ncbi:MAG TPA: LytR C-terminal domain-containing protein [Ilumatobacter sp.]|nr:LytR C-terminal domain-containing protein [Ilumatobacter sp.]
MSDGYDGSGQIPRRSPRVNDHAAPVSGVLAIVLAAVAVIAGFFILRSITDGGDGTVGGLTDAGAEVGETGDSSGATTTDPSATLATPPATTQPSFVVAGATIVVANANGQGGSAGDFGTVLATAVGFTIADPPVNANASSDDLDTSAIFYDSANPVALDVANSLNQVMGGTIPVDPMPADGPPTVDGELSGGQVLLMLGTDFARSTAADLVLPLAGGGTTADTTTTTLAGGVASVP